MERPLPRRRAPLLARRRRPCAPELAARLPGSADLFDHRRRRPWASVNFVTAHDGFTLHDLVSYDDKHNEANGEDNRDGTNDNHSSTGASRAETDDPDDPSPRATRSSARCWRRCLASARHADAAGRRRDSAAPRAATTTPTARTTRSAGSTGRWPPTPEAEALRRFTRALIALRRRLPPLRPAIFLHGATELRPGLNDIAWFDEHGQPMTPEAWNETEARTLALRRAADGGGRQRRRDAAAAERRQRRPRLRAAAAAAGLARGARQRPSGRRRAAGAGRGRCRSPPHGAVLLAASLHHDRLRAADPLGRDAARPRPHPLPALGAGCAAGGAGDRAARAAADDTRRAMAGSRWRPRSAPARATASASRPTWRCPTRRRGCRRATCTTPPSSSIPRAYRLAAAGLARPALARDGAVRAACRRHGRLRRRAGGAAAAARPRRHRDRADADRRFPGARNWGYDGVLPYAPDTAYGTPDELKALVDAAHGLGLMVFLDVVYNHFGPDGTYLHAYAKRVLRRGRPHALGRRHRFPPAAGARLLRGERAVLAERVPLRRAALRRGACDRRGRLAGRAGRRASAARSRTATSTWCWRTSTTAPPPAARRRASTRSGTTTATTSCTRC